MADLEDFLRQAAERRKQKNSAAPSRSSPQPPVAFPASTNPPPTLTPILLDDDSPSSDSVAKSGVHLRSTLPQNQHLALEIDQADERMLGHVQEVFQHAVGHLPPKTGKEAPSKESMSNQETAVQRAAENRIGKDVLKMLADPQMLKAAFIASEIFQRRF